MKARGKGAPGAREEAGLYSAVAPVYDRLGEHISYVDYADFIAANADEMGIPRDSLGFDAGCGTGVLTCLLAEKGYDMIGADVSPEMLLLASARAQREGKRILFLLQDLRSFELYGTVKLAVCTVDSLNYLLKREDVAAFFGLVANYLEPGGLFLFDVTTKYKFETVYGDRDYILEEKGAYCGWQNHYDRKSGICAFALSVFTEGKNGYTRRDELQRQRYWSERQLKTLLKASGLRVRGLYGGLLFEAPREKDERQFWVCEKA